MRATRQMNGNSPFAENFSHIFAKEMEDGVEIASRCRNAESWLLKVPII